MCWIPTFWQELHTLGWWSKVKSLFFYFVVFQFARRSLSPGKFELLQRWQRCYQSSWEQNLCLRSEEVRQTVVWDTYRKGLSVKSCPTTSGCSVQRLDVIGSAKRRVACIVFCGHLKVFGHFFHGVHIKIQLIVLQYRFQCAGGVG